DHEAPRPRRGHSQLPGEPAGVGLGTLGELSRRDDDEAGVTPVEGVLRALRPLAFAEGREDITIDRVVCEVVVAGSWKERHPAEETGVGFEELPLQVGWAAAGVR